MCLLLLDSAEFQEAADHRVGTGRARHRTAKWAPGTMSTIIRLDTPKDPNTEEFFEFEPGLQFITGDGIASVLKCFVAKGDSSLVLLDDPEISDDGRKASVLIGGGRLGQTYWVTLRFTTTLGETLELTLEFDCAHQRIAA